MTRMLWILALQLLIGTAWGADYAREQKWADEVTPTIVAGDPVYLEARNHKFLTLFTEVPDAKVALVIVHGLGVHPDWNLIGVLRTQLADAGYTTLSVQMPVLKNEARGEDYPPTFPEAAQRLEQAVAFLKAKGYKKVAIVSHSMGSRMSHYYLSRAKGHPVDAWVAIGMGGPETYRGFGIPVLDLYGENDLPIVLKGAAKRVASLKANAKSAQIVAPKTDHFFTDRDAELVKYVKEYLDKALGG
ncbi:MAG: alpha/beta fold hydrolase [Sulfuricella sp.]